MWLPAAQLINIPSSEEPRPDGSPGHTRHRGESGTRGSPQVPGPHRAEQSGAPRTPRPEFTARAGRAPTGRQGRCRDGPALRGAWPPPPGTWRPRVQALTSTPTTQPASARRLFNTWRPHQQEAPPSLHLASRAHQEASWSHGRKRPLAQAGNLSPLLTT